MTTQDEEIPTRADCRLWRSMLYLFLDLEATSVAARNAHIIQMCGVLAKASCQDGGDGLGYDVVSTFDEYVKPPVAIPYAVQELTGITQTRIQTCAAFADCWQKFVKWFASVADGPCAIVGHNLFAYDLVLLANEVCRLRVGHDFKAWYSNANVVYEVDTLRLCRADVAPTAWPHSACLSRTKTGKISFTLTSLYRAMFGKDIKGAHNALADTSALVEMCLDFRSPLRNPLSRLGARAWCRPTHAVRPAAANPRPDATAVTCETTHAMIAELWSYKRKRDRARALSKIPLWHPTFIQCCRCPVVYSSYFVHRCDTE